MTELVVITRTGLPLIVAFFLQYFLSVSPMLVISRVSNLALGASSLATMYMNVTYMGVIQGCVTAIDSFAPQAYGAGNLALVGESVQKNLMVNLVMLIPMIILCWNSEFVLNALQPDPELSKLAQDYLRVVTFGMPGLLGFELGKRFLQAQKIFHASTYVLLVVSPLSLILTYLFVFPLGFGYIGAPIVISLSYWLMALLLLGYIRFVDGSQCWAGWNRRTLFTNLYEQFYLAIFSLVAVEAEYFAFEVMSLAASYFGEIELAVQSICSATGSLIFQVPFALACAVSTHIGQLIGAGNKENAIKSTYICMKGATILGFISFAVLMILIVPITRVFTDDKEVAHLCYQVLPILFFTQCYDTLNVTSAGLLRSQRRQDIGSMMNLFSYYVIGLPLAYLLAFQLDLQVKGLWIGLTICVFLLTVAEVIVLLKTNWDKVLKNAEDDPVEEFY
ncbi:hypothetical protein CANARDRAFT_173863 [[Candida] arabinofermentans NRRL YB-2248]|uniref:MATE efflux family protein n=1 Tax=[Candida] arabinofermentans NRRL YB-2248 TaxID=983967 RepID=A0A1E4T8C1_9ASCO|nr:hypothetical protein CANARDRAFT_173863 [[Candida] arabinofermentans NRRL YB-2248]